MRSLAIDAPISGPYYAGRGARPRRACHLGDVAICTRVLSDRCRHGDVRQSAPLHSALSGRSNGGRAPSLEMEDCGVGKVTSACQGYASSAYEHCKPQPNRQTLFGERHCAHARGTDRSVRLYAQRELLGDLGAVGWRYLTPMAAHIAHRVAARQLHWLTCARSVVSQAGPDSWSAALTPRS
jgi:hypothetical protein